MARRLTVIVPLLFVLGACAGGGTAPAAAPAAAPVGATVAEVTTGNPAPAAATATATATATDTATATATDTATATATATDGASGSPSGTGPVTAMLGNTPSAGSTPGDGAPSATAAYGEGDASDEEDPGQDLPGLVLEAGGLGVISADTHITHLAFGTSAKRVRATVRRLVGPLVARRRSCAGVVRTVSTTRGFSVVAAGDRFVGWVDRGAAGRHLSTADGIAVGITVADLQAGGTEVTVHRAASGAVTWTSGPDGLLGRATGPAPAGRVTVVSSGEAC